MAIDSREAFLQSHRQALSIGVAVVVGVAMFVVFGGFSGGGGNALAAVVFGIGIWLGMHLVIYWYTRGRAPTRDIHNAD
jgi:hypothetical protein